MKEQKERKKKKEIKETKEMKQSKKTTEQKEIIETPESKETKEIIETSEEKQEKAIKEKIQLKACEYQLYKNIVIFAEGKNQESIEWIVEQLINEKNYHKYSRNQETITCTT